MTSVSNETILKLTDLRVESISGLVLVDNVSLELRRGEVVGRLARLGLAAFREERVDRDPSG